MRLTSAPSLLQLFYLQDWEVCTQSTACWAKETPRWQLGAWGSGAETKGAGGEKSSAKRQGAQVTPTVIAHQALVYGFVAEPSFGWQSLALVWHQEQTWLCPEELCWVWSELELQGQTHRTKMDGLWLHSIPGAHSQGFEGHFFSGRNLRSESRFPPEWKSLRKSKG